MGSLIIRKCFDDGEVTATPLTLKHVVLLITSVLVVLWSTNGSEASVSKIVGFEGDEETIFLNKNVNVCIDSESLIEQLL